MRVLIGFSLLLALAGCGSVRWATQPDKFSFEQPQPLLLAPPVGLVGLIERGSTGFENADLSQQAGTLLGTTLQAQREALHLGPTLAVPAPLAPRLRREVYGAVQALLRSTPKAGTSVYPARQLPLIDSLSQDSPARYVLLSLRSGYTRTLQNRRAQTAQTLGVGLLTMGMLIPVSTRATAGLYLMVYDRQEQRMVFFARTSAEKEPLDPAGLQRQLRTALEGTVKLR